MVPINLTDLPYEINKNILIQDPNLRGSFSLINKNFNNLICTTDINEVEVFIDRLINNLRNKISNSLRNKIGSILGKPNDIDYINVDTTVTELQKYRQFLHDDTKRREGIEEITRLVVDILEGLSRK